MWKYKHHGGILDDPKQKTLFGCFKTAFPMTFLDSIERYTNQYIESNRLGGPVTKRELLWWMGIRLGMTLERSHGSVENYWDEEGTKFLLP